MYIIKRNTLLKPETKVIPTRPAESVLATPIDPLASVVTPAPVEQPKVEPLVVVRSQRPRQPQRSQQRPADTASVVIGRTGSDIHRPSPPAALPPTPVAVPVVEPVIAEEPKTMVPNLSKVALQATQYRYFVTGIDNPYPTLREAVDAFPDERGKYDDRHVQWSSLPKYVRDNIRRESVT